MANPNLENIKLFAVRNKEGKWFRRKGYGGFGDSWVDEFKKARLYTKPGPARTVISFFNNRWPEFGVPDLIQFNVGSMTVLDEAARVAKDKQKKERAILRAKERQAQYELENAQRQLKDAQDRVQRLSKK